VRAFMTLLATVVLPQALNAGYLTPGAPAGRSGGRDSPLVYLLSPTYLHLIDRCDLESLGCGNLYLLYGAGTSADRLRYVAQHCAMHRLPYVPSACAA